MIDHKTTEYYNQEFSDLDLSHSGLNIEVFEEVEFDSCVFINCNLSETEFKHCKFIDCQFKQCNLSNIKISYSRFNDTGFEHCKMLGIDWTRAHWPNLALAAPISFRHCILNDNSFYGLELAELQLESCKLHHVDFREGNFAQSNFRNSDFSSALFNSSQLRECDFTDAYNYQIDINFNYIQQAIFSRDQAINLLAGLDIELVD